MKDYTFSRVSPITGRKNEMTIRLNYEDYCKWSSGGGLIQNCLPYLTADECEFLMTGILPSEWESMFKDSKNEESSPD